MRKILLSTIYILLMTCIFIRCKSLKNSENTMLEPIPDSYTDTKDSSTSAAINWKEYFTDSTLLGLIDTALHNNLDVLKAMQRIESARSSVLLSKGALFPTVTGNVSLAQRRYGLYTMDGAGNITTDITPGQIVPIHLRDYYIGVQMSWEADIWGKLRNRKKAAYARYLESVEGKNLIVSNLVEEIAISYYELLTLDNELDIIQETIKLQENALEIVKVQKQVGSVNELAIKQFEGQLLNSKALAKETNQSIIEIENKINFLSGRFPHPIKRNKEQFLLLMPAQVTAGVPSDLLKYRPDIRQAEHALQASKADVKAAKAAFYPSLNITGGYGFQAFNTNYLFTTPESMAYTIFGGLVAPLINRSAIKADFRNANAMQREALYNYQQGIINGYVEVYNELSRINNLEQIQQIRSEQTNSFTQSVEISTELFKTGRATYLEVLLAQKNALDSQLELVNTKKRQLFATVSIYKALGGGWQ